MKEVYSNPFLDVDEFDYNNIPHTKVRKKDVVCGIVLDKHTREFVFVEQYRPVIDEDMVECVAGHINDNEYGSISIKREVMEEVGYRCDRIYYITNQFTSPGFTTELIYFYLIIGEHVESGGGVECEGEETTVLKYCINTIKRNTFERVSFDLKTSYCVNLIKNNYEQYFTLID